MVLRILLLSILAVCCSCSLDTAPSSFPGANGNCQEAGRAAVSAPVHRGAMVLVPAGCRNFTDPGRPPLVGYDYHCVSSFWMDTTETSIATYRRFMGPVEAALHTYAAGKPSDCPNCPMDDLTYFDAVLYANARTKAELGSSDTVYSYSSVVTSATANSLIRNAKPTEVTDLVGLRADTTRSGFRLPSRAEYGWAALQDSRDTTYQLGLSDSLYQWTRSNSGGTTHPTGVLRPNPFGIHDWDGNVCEWTTEIDSTTSPSMRTRLALGGSWEQGPSAEMEVRDPNSLEDFWHAGVRLVRNADSGTTSILPRPCPR